MLKLTEEETTILLEINKKIIYNTNVKWKKHITSILKIANREHYLANREPKKLTFKNQEEMASFDERMEDYYNEMIPFTNQLIFHKEIKRLLLGKDTTYYINPLEIYKYYTGRNNRITLIKLIILISQNNAKFTNQDIGALMHFEKLLGTIFISSDYKYETIINIFSNYLKALELECQKLPANLINLKAINRINKELIITLEKYLKNEKITEEAPKSLTIEKLDNAKK